MDLKQLYVELRETPLMLSAMFGRDLRKVDCFPESRDRFCGKGNLKTSRAGV